MRASDIVKGKIKPLVNGNGDKQPLLIPQGKIVNGERGLLRMRDIDIPSLQSPTGKGARTTSAAADMVSSGGYDEGSGPGLFERILGPDGRGRALPPDHESSLPAHEGAAVRKIYLAAKEYMALIRRSVLARESFPLEPALVYVNNILNSSVDVTSQIYQLTVDYEREDDYYLSSPVNVMVYGLKVAQGMGYEKTRLIELGLAALLHDVGMFLVPDAVLKKEGRLTEEEMNLIRRHPETAVEILAAHRDVYPKMLRAIYEHQERANGQGYPRGLKGGEICEYAQIIGICDSYEAMTHHRPHKKPLLQTESIKELIGSRSNLFDPRIIKAFLDEISIFPVGAYVRLNNRNIGRVVATNRGNPMKPVLRLVSDEKGRPIEPGRMLDLRNHPILNIERSVSFDETAP
ncbi:MAG: HD-GYP domain-containing protein [Pseudomonadota bacterium]|nr:HD-GYP domain-containing protein [Pseudomonadota bacterium]